MVSKTELNFKQRVSLFWNVDETQNIVVYLFLLYVLSQYLYLCQIHKLNVIFCVINEQFENRKTCAFLIDYDKQK